MLGHEVTKLHPDGLADGTIDITLTGSAGQSFGAFLPRRRHPAAVRRRQRLRRQGPVRRPRGRPAGPRGGVRRRAEHRRRQRHRLRRDERRDLPARQGRRAVLRPQLRRGRGRRGRGRPRLRVHDRWHACVVLGPTGRNFAAGMSGGTAYVLDLRPERVNPELVDLTPLTDDEAEQVHGLLARHAEETESAVAARLLADWPAARERFTAVMPRDYRRVLEVRRPGRARRASTPTAATSGRGSWRRLVADPRGLPDRPRPRAAARGGRSRCGSWTGARSTRQQDADRAAAPGRPLHGLRHPVLPPGLPAGQPDPGVERPGLARGLGGRDRAAARDQQLPGVHRPALPGAVRDRLRARHQPAAGDDQAGRGQHHRAGLRRPATSRRSRRSGSAGARSRWSAAGRPAWPPPSS